MRLKYVAELTMGQSPPSDVYNREGEGRPFLQGCAEFGETHPRPKVYCGEATKLCRDGDVLLSVRAPVGAMNIADATYGIGRGLCAIRPRNGRLDRSYLRFALQEVTAELASVATGSTYDAVTVDQVANIELAVPPVDRQGRIADFLDRKTAAIDELIGKKERLIELLQEKRQALITEAVTKGLDPAVPMKESGVPAFPEVQAHWKVLPVRRVVAEFVDYRGRTPTKVPDGIPLITAGAIRNGRIDHSRAPEFMSEGEYDEFMRRGQPSRGDVVFTTEAPLGEVALVEDESHAFAQRIILFRVNRLLMDSRFLWLFYRSSAGRDEVQSRASGSTAEGIRADRLRASAVAVPPLREQGAIAKSVMARVAAEEPLDELIQRQIVRLREYRQALITAAVTGQLEVA